MKEYGVFKLSPFHLKNSDFLNEKAKMGWNLISIISFMENQETIIHAYMEKNVTKTKQVIKG